MSVRARYAFAVLLCAVAAGCQSPAPLGYAGLESTPKLHPNPGDRTGRIPYNYKTNTDWPAYRKVILDPVVIYRGEDNQFGKMPEQDKQALARDAQEEFAKALGKRFELVEIPDTETLRIRVTLAGARPGKPVVGALTKVDLLGGVYNIVQATRGREGMLSGSVNYAVEIHDASSNRLLEAYVAKQYPSAMNIRTGWTRLDASRVGLRKGAEELAEKLS